jgi:hypothetical protein
VACRTLTACDRQTHDQDLALGRRPRAPALRAVASSLKEQGVADVRIPQVEKSHRAGTPARRATDRTDNTFSRIERLL